jgi:hypothetical protein
MYRYAVRHREISGGGLFIFARGRIMIVRKGE